MSHWGSLTSLYIIGNAEKEKREFNDMLKDLRIQAKFEVHNSDYICTCTNYNIRFLT